MSDAANLSELRDRIAPGLADRYEILREIGQGGMAAVFLATDLRHERSVALKVFRPDVASIVGSERFLREIKTTANLHHPHILPLLDSGTVDGLLYYVMPFVEEGSLRERLRHERQLSIEESVKVATGVAAALDYAHRHGIIHRDIKPENVLLHDGEALVADFGIALAVRAAGGTRLTEAGFSMGTPEYMSPEQAAGDSNLDARTDTYALGCVVYEMLTGEPPHTGATVQAIVAKVMTERPTSVSVVRRDVPQHIEAAVHRSLAKVPADRFATTAGFAEALTDPDRITSGRLAAAALPRKSPWHRLGRWALGVAAAATLIGVGLRVFAPSQATNGEARIRQLTFLGDAEAAALDPGGTTVAFLTNQNRTLILRDVSGQGEMTLVESDEPLGRPRWSPDGSRLLFAGPTDDRRGILTVSRLGGPPTPIVRRLPGRRPQFSVHAGYDFVGSTDRYAIACCGPRVYVGPDPSAIAQVAPDSFTVADGTLIDLGDVAQMILDVRVSPDGRVIAFVGMTAGQRTVLGLAAVDESELNVIATDESVGLSSWEAFSSLQWSLAGNQLYYVQSAGQGASLMRVPVSTRRSAATGPARSVLPTLPAGVAVSVAEDRGRVAYTGGPSRTALEFVERGATRPQRVSRGTWTYLHPSLSPDGQRLAYLKVVNADRDVFVMDLPEGQEQQVADHASPWTQPSWSADGRHLAYIGVVDDTNELRWVGLASGQVRRVAAMGTGFGATPVWAPDGKSLLVVRQGRGLASFDVTTGVETLIELTALRQIVTTARPSGSSDSSPPPPEGSGRQRPGQGPGGGRMLSPVLSPDGTRVALFVAAPGQTGLWTASVAGAQPHKLVDGNALPLVWGDTDVIYFVRSEPGDSGRTIVEAVNAVTGSAGPSLPLPISCDAGSLSVSRDGNRAVCAVREAESDVWVVDNLDLGR